MVKDSRAAQSIWPDVPQPLMSYSPVLRVADWIFISGQLASDFRIGIAGEARAAAPNVVDEQTLQARFATEKVKRAPAAAGTDMASDIVRIWQSFSYDTPTMHQFAGGNLWPGLSSGLHLHNRNDYIVGPRPASTAVSVRPLPLRGARTEVDVIATVDDTAPQGFGAPAGIPMPIAGYPLTFRRGDWAFPAGEVPIDWIGDWSETRSMGGPGTLAKAARNNSRVWSGLPLEAQTDCTLCKLATIAEAAGSSLGRAVETDVYVSDPSNTARMDRVWKRWFPASFPARCVIPSMGLGTRGSRIEIAFMLLADDNTLTAEQIQMSDVSETLNHEPQGVEAGHPPLLSQQMVCDSRRVLAEGMIHCPELPWCDLLGQAQMRYRLKNVATTCEAAGGSLDNVLRRACFHDAGDRSAALIEEWAQRFPGIKPASTTMKTGRSAVVPGANALLDLVANVPN